MNLSDLLNNKKIRKIESDKKEASSCLKKAEKDLKISKKNLSVDFDWCFAIAYNSMLLSARAVMFLDGYTPSGEDHHKTTIDYADVKFSDKYSDITSYFKKMRSKRHDAIYWESGSISETEAKHAINLAEKFLKIVKEKIGV